MTHTNTRKVPTDTFDAFVASERSQTAFAAAVAVAKNPGHAAHNPFLIYGRVGSGKSHLLHAIAHAIRSRFPDTRIMHLAAETLIARLVDAIRTDALPLFRRSIATFEVLLLDDLPCAPGREHTLEEIFRGLEESSKGGVQVVVTCEVPPSTLVARSRPFFERSLIVEVGYPDPFARVEIARRTAEMWGIALSDDLLRYMAKNLIGPREIQNAIARIAAESTLSGLGANGLAIP